MAGRRPFPLHSREDTVLHGDHHPFLQVVHKSVRVPVQELRRRLETGRGVALGDQAVSAVGDRVAGRSRRERRPARRRTRTDSLLYVPTYFFFFLKKFRAQRGTCIDFTTIFRATLFRMYTVPTEIAPIIYVCIYAHVTSR